MAVRKPCPTCPWRVDQDATVIPGFVLEKAEGLVHTSRDAGGNQPGLNAPFFACHQSRPEQEVYCAGWLAVEGWDHVGVRLAMARGDVKPEWLNPGDDWPELHTNYPDVLEKLRRTCPPECKLTTGDETHAAADAPREGDQRGHGHDHPEQE